MSYMSGLMIGTALIRGLGGMLSGGAAGGMGGGMGMGMSGGMGRSAGMSGLLGMAATGMAAGMGRGAMGGMGRSGGMSGLFSMMPTGMGSGMSGMFSQGAGRGAGCGKGMAQGQGAESFAALPALPTFALKSAVPGRRRYYASGLQGNEELAAFLEKNLARIAWVDSVKASSVTGSLLIVYSGSEEDADRLMADIGKRVFGASSVSADFNVPQTAQPVLSAAKVTQPLAEVGASIRRTVGALNAWLREKTDGWLDFPSVFAIGFVVRGLRKVLLYDQRPSGPQMLWWAFSILKGWKML